MTLPRAAAGVLSGHVMLEVRCIGRVMLTVRQPRPQYGQGIRNFFGQHRGSRFVSPALMLPVTARFGAGIRHYIDARRPGPGPVRDGGRARTRSPGSTWPGITAGECIVFAGVAREKNRVGRTAQRRDRATGKRYPWLCRPGAMAGHWHFYGFDADFGPFPITFCGYSRSPGRSTSTATKTPGSSAGRKASPSRAWITRSARSAARRRPRRICDGLTGQKIYRFAGTWLARLPQPFTRAGQDAGYRWPLPAGQVEFSATMAPDRPVSGRIFSRAADPRQPRHRPPGQGDHRLRPGHRPARQVRPPRDLPHPGHHHRHLPLPLPVRQEDPRRAVPQRRTGAPHQDHHQPAPRPRHRQGADQPRRPGHGRRHGQRRQISKACAGSAPTRSSNASRTAAPTRSPPTACPPPCSSPA